MKPIIITGIITFIVGFAWGAGVMSIICINSRRKRLTAARIQRLNPIAYQPPVLPGHISRARAIVKQNKDGQTYLARFDA